MKAICKNSREQSRNKWNAPAQWIAGKYAELTQFEHVIVSSSVARTSASTAAVAVAAAVDTGAGRPKADSS